MSGRGRVCVGAALGLALACASPPPPPPNPALVAVEVLRGFESAPGPRGEPRLVALLDATADMSVRNSDGIALFAAARAGAERWLRALPTHSEVELRVQGGEASTGCASPARRLAGPASATDPALLAALADVAPAGQGSLAESLSALAKEIEGARSPVRVVAWSALRDRCDASLCEAARALARRGARLDLIVLGDATAPECLATLSLPPDGAAPAAREAPVGFRVERLEPSPAVIGCSESGGLPVVVPVGTTRLVVGLEPPLVVERSFPPGTRWTLEVLDFPTLGRDAREWRWRPLAGAGPPDAAR